MANVRCPMCSKLNPPDAEACSYCGARLKPLRSPSGAVPPAGAPAGKKSEDSETPDWLSSLRSDEPVQPDETSGGSSEPGESEQEAPDWLSRIRSRSSSQPAEGSQDETPDWMKGIGSTSGSSEESGTGWLRGLTGDHPEEPSAGSGTPLFQEETPAQPSNEDDWLNQLADWNAPQPHEPQSPASTAPAPAEPSPAEEDFSWLSSFAQDNRAPAEEPPAEEEGGLGLTSFLSSIEQPSEGEQAPDEPLWTPPQEQKQSPAESSGFGLTGFLTGLDRESPSQDQEPEGAAQVEPETGGELPIWFGDEPSTTQEPTAAEPSADTSFADWLQGLESAQPAAQEPEPPQQSGPIWLNEQPLAETPSEQPAEQGELPDWLEGAEPLPPQVVKPSTEEDGLPSWLAGFGESALPAEEAPDLGATVSGTPEASAPETGDEESLPSWMGMESGEAETPAPAESAPPVAGFTDWFSSFGQPPAEPEAQAPAAEEPGAATEQPDQEQPAVSSDVPEWLREFNTQPGPSVSMPPLIESEGPLEPSPAMEGDQPFAVELPDWLAEDAAQHAPENVEQPAEAASEQLAQADLPEWVKEMRPIESIIPGEAQMAEVDRHTERSGPLAGMNGILPAEELVSQYRKPPVYSVKLRVTEKQRSQGSQLETILAQETQPLMIPPQGRRAQGLLLRILIALLIIGVLAAPPLLGLNPLAMPMLSPGENEQMYDQIEKGITQDAPVLLAVDFEPAFYGEMKMAALPVIDHLMAKNARIVVVSTRPTGPALAEQLLTEAKKNHTGFDLLQRTTNLGYLPGDMISLLEFARQPAFAAPATLTGEMAWSQPNLQGIQSIQDFAQVIVITDTAETGRAWVEQVQPLMGDTPLMMVTSAQAGPMMAPFVESDQIDGMVSGLLGGVMYAQRTRQETPASSLLASYQVGVLLAFGLTLVGSVISGGASLFKREDKDED